MSDFILTPLQRFTPENETIVAIVTQMQRFYYFMRPADGLCETAIM